MRANTSIVARKTRATTGEPRACALPLRGLAGGTLARRRGVVAASMVSYMSPAPSDRNFLLRDRARLLHAAVEPHLSSHAPSSFLSPSPHRRTGHGAAGSRPLGL